MNTLTFITHNDSEIDNGGTSLVGSIDIGYNQLKKVFGKPLTYDKGDKVDAEWLIQFNDGSVATIYNYKNGKNYDNKGLPKTKITNWHIGGFSDAVVLKLEVVLSKL
jgi:hypothetical protein